MDEKSKWIFILFILFTLGFFSILGILENSDKEAKATKILQDKLKREKLENKKQTRRNKNKMEVNKLLFPPITENPVIGSGNQQPKVAAPQPHYSKSGKLENGFGEMGRVICPRGFHYKPQGTFGHASCVFNSSGCAARKYDKVNGNCLECEMFYSMNTDLFNKTKYCSLGTFWTILMYGTVLLIFLGQCAGV